VVSGHLGHDGDRRCSWPREVRGHGVRIQRDGVRWKQSAELRGSDVVAENGFGTSVAISGSTAIVGEEGYAKGTGRAYVFTKTTSGWTRVALLKAPDTMPATTSDFGGCLTPDRGRGCIRPGKLRGRAYLFTDTDGGLADGRAKGSDTTVGDYFGISAGISARAWS